MYPGHKLRPGDLIEYLVDVSSPPNQKGFRGQTKIIDRDIPLWTAKYLLRGGKIRLYDSASPLKLEEEEIKEGTDGPAEIPGPGATGQDSKAGTKTRKERRTRTNGQGKTNSETDQKGDHGSERPDPKGGA